MIQAQNVHKKFGPVHAVRGISFEVEPGQVLGILGPNGAGKTTTIRMITGSFPPTEGTVTVDGMDTITKSIQTRERLGYLPEGAPFYPEMRVEQYLDYRAKLFGLSRTERRTRAGVVIERCALGEMRRRRIHTLSKGYTQRVGLAGAMVHDPPVLILDEPTSGLDPAQIAETRSLIRDLSGDHTMLLVSHILPEVEKACDRILIFARGRVRAEGAPADLIRNMAGRRGLVVETADAAPDGAGAEEILASVPGVRTLTARPLGDGFTSFDLELDEAPAGDPRERVAKRAQEAGLLVRELRAKDATLEELYIRLISSVDEEGDS